MPTLGPTELIIVLVLVVIVFGVGKLPEVGGALGKSIKEFRKASDEPEAQSQQETVAREPERPRQPEAVREVDASRDAEIESEVQRRLREKETARKD